MKLGKFPADFSGKHCLGNEGVNIYPPLNVTISREIGRGGQETVEKLEIPARLKLNAVYSSFNGDTDQKRKINTTLVGNALTFSIL